MAGTFTHWMVVEEAINRLDKLPERHHYFSILKAKSHFVILGAVGPDYPYLSELTKQLFKHHSWANRMHYENTGGFVKYGIDNLPKPDEPHFERCLAWLCGYITHLVADSVIHPVVNAIVGPYIFNSGEHRHCEMIQDTHTFREVKGVELSYADYTELIRMCSDSGNKMRLDPAVGDFWVRTLRASHPSAKDKFDAIRPDDWHRRFVSVINLAADPVPIFRHIGEEKHLVYKKSVETTSAERKRFIQEIRLPGGETGNFKEHAFDKAVNAVIDIWQRLFVDVADRSADNCLSYIRNWNLDSGLDEDQPYFWS